MRIEKLIKNDWKLHTQSSSHKTKYSKQDLKTPIKNCFLLISVMYVTCLHTNKNNKIRQ